MPKTPSEPLHTEKPPANPWWRLMHEASDTFDRSTRQSMIDAAKRYCQVEAMSGKLGR